jgi:hypothetical protein
MMRDSRSFLGGKEKLNMEFQFSNRMRMGGTSARIAFALAVAAASPALAKGPKRCDWHGPLSSGESPFVKCVDFASLQGKELTLPKNVTRISADGLSFCATKTQVAGPSEADIVFVYDNSGSMTADAAYIDPVKKDTVFYFFDNNNTCKSNNTPDLATLTYQVRNGTTRTIPLFTKNTGCVANDPGDPYNARGEVIKDGIDFLATTSPTSTAGVVSFSDGVKYPHAPVAVNDKSAVAEVKATITLDTDGGTSYGPPLRQAKTWLNDPALIKTKKQAIVFISDGAPHDNYSGIVDADMPPIYSIYLARAATPDTAKLLDLSTTTGGTFSRVNPNDPTAIDKVLKQIIAAITSNPGAPKSATITNKTLKPPQTSRSLGVTANPDGSTGMKLDSIIALDAGKNTIEIEVTRDDNTSSTYTFTMNVAGDEISSTSGNYSCYDQPTLTAIDKATNQAPDMYSPEKTSYKLQLTRSPSDLGAVSVDGSSPNNDKETIKLGQPDLSKGVPTQTGDFSYNPDKGSATAGNGVLEVNNHGDITFAWSHPRDRRETVTYVLPGRIVPVLSGQPQVEWVTDLTKQGGGDVVVLSDAPKSVVIMTDLKGKCIVNCSGTELYHDKVTIPSMKVTLRSPIDFTARVFDNFGQFVNDQKGSMDSTIWNSLAKKGDSAVVLMKFLPYAKTGQPLGTGAYIMQLNVTAKGDQVTKNTAGETIVVRNARKEYVSRFGYLRGHD